MSISSICLDIVEFNRKSSIKKHFFPTLGLVEYSFYSFIESIVKSWYTHKESWFDELNIIFNISNIPAECYNFASINKHSEHTYILQYVSERKIRKMHIILMKTQNRHIFKYSSISSIIPSCQHCSFRRSSCTTCIAE